MALGFLKELQLRYQTQSMFGLARFSQFQERHDKNDEMGLIQALCFFLPAYPRCGQATCVLA